MTQINPAYVNEGIVEIRRSEVADVRLPAQTDAVVSGGPMERHIDAIFRGRSAQDIALDLTRPHIENPDFERAAPRAAMLQDHAGRLRELREADPGAMSDEARRADAVFEQLRAAAEVFDNNKIALTQS